MNKKIFTGLVILMGISILGIIAVQLIWMNNALRVKNEMFNRGVNDAIHKTINKLEDIHNVGVVHNMLFTDDSLSWIHEDEKEFEFDVDEDMEWHVAPESIRVFHNNSPEKKRPVRIIREFAPGKNEAVIEIKVDENDENSTSVQSFSYYINSDPIKASEIVDEKQLDRDEIIIINKDTIFSDVDSLYQISKIRIDSLLTNLDTFAILKPEISKRVRLKAGTLKRVANKMVTEVSTWDVRKIDTNRIYEVLKMELQENNIPIGFEFGIVRDSIVEFPMEVTDSAKVANTVFQANLYPNDIFQKNIKLVVFFPERDSFIYRSLNWLLIASFLFSLFILVTFSLSIFFILRQKKISEMKSDFINNMTHEFKTPIATISVATDSINNDKVVKDPDKIRYFTGMIKKENARMNRHVEDILTIARLDKKDFEFNWEAINVHDLIEDAIQGIVLQVEKRGGKIDAILEAANSMITTDKMHCTNVVYNLLDNAIKYSTDKPEIKVSTTNKTNGVLILVEDNGIGMTKAVQNKIFERFYRQTIGNVHNVKGFGLGLSYVKAVLEANQGTISVQSEPGNGSKFELFLPFVRK
ncbi:HAMP domain-containing histidine kinase [Draconibacterium sp.]|nr:HAMP domain-containing histidine kinase [Draconibacterium sp.]